jgi:hypothetical protein
VTPSAPCFIVLFRRAVVASALQSGRRRLSAHC